MTCNLKGLDNLERGEVEPLDGDWAGVNLEEDKRHRMGEGGQLLSYAWALKSGDEIVIGSDGVHVPDSPWPSCSGRALDPRRGRSHAIGRKGMQSPMHGAGSGGRRWLISRAFCAERRAARWGRLPAWLPARAGSARPFSSPGSSLPPRSALWVLSRSGSRSVRGAVRSGGARPPS